MNSKNQLNEINNQMKGQPMSALMEIFTHALAGHDTEFAGLHPFVQERAKQYQSAVQDAANHLQAIETFGLTWVDMRTAHFDALAINGDYEENGWSARPASFRVGYHGRYELPEFPVLYTLPGDNSVLLATCHYTELNDRGYGDHRTARYAIIGQYDSAEEAEGAAKVLSRAIVFFYQELPRLLGDDGQRGEASARRPRPERSRDW